VPGELFVSVSGISDRTLAGLNEFSRLLDGRGIGLSLFVAPRRKHGYRLESDPATVDWLRDRRALGDAIVLHGFDEAATRRRRSEFAVLPAHEANLRLIAADRTLERIGMRTRLFAAPGWAASAGTVTALRRNGFRLLIGRHESTDLVRGASNRGRVFGIGAGTSPKDIPELVRGVLYLPVLQLMAFYRSVAKGLNPDRPANLTAVVKLDL
jgi:predicted deacetylase